ncbi:MAG: peptidase serine carboxypeptidase [Acidobacteria bacterium]|jgi:carboxypeptidase C (cathepsin A)|nr:peptidase serine carboxypeptidase [Acidobacteriota bacterium]
MIASIFFSFFFLFQIQTAPTAKPSETPKPAETAQQKDEAPVVSKHSIRLNGKQLDYTVTTGFMPIKNERSGDTEARIFFMAYTLDNPPAKRPLMFSFNGGPGSASVWLHLGALGPKRVKMLDNGMMPPPPYELVDNEATWLTETDMVFVDTVGTGYSRATKQEFASKFFSVNGDIESVGEFIRLYLGRYGRWTSPLFLVGESYGTTRVSGLTNHLFERGIGLNGILLVSTVLNFQTIRFAENNDLPLVLILPSYAATAWYHKQLAPELQNKPLRQVLQEAENFAANEFMPALLKIDRLTSAERQNLLDKFSFYTGLSKNFIEQNNFRVELDEFNKELLRNQRRTTGRLDSRFTGIDRDAARDNPDFDPSMTAIRPPYTAAFNEYVRRDLGFKSDSEYFILGGGITAPWNYNVSQGYADTSMSLKSAMAKNPYMKVFVASGYYDMATPYFAAEYTISAMNLDPTLRKNISVSYYEAGHMMYIEKTSLQKLKDDAAAFIRNSAGK